MYRLGQARPAHTLGAVTQGFSNWNLLEARMDTMKTISNLPTTNDGADFPRSLPVRSLFLIDLLLKGEKGLSPVRLLVRSPGQLMKIARTSQPVEIAIYELRDLSTTPIDSGLERVVELGGLADGTVEYALDSGERYVAWTGENPSAVD